jgi:hypothetical protein
LQERLANSECRHVSVYSAKKEPPNLGSEYLYSPFPLLAVMSKMRTSQTVRDDLTDCPRLNSTGKTRSQQLLEVPVGPGGLSAWALRTVRGHDADRPPGLPELHTVLSSFEVNNGLSAIDPRTVRHRPTDCPPGSDFSRKPLRKSLDIK